MACDPGAKSTQSSDPQGIHIHLDTGCRVTAGGRETDNQENRPSDTQI